MGVWGSGFSVQDRAQGVVGGRGTRGHGTKQGCMHGMRGGWVREGGGAAHMQLLLRVGEEEGQGMQAMRRARNAPPCCGKLAMAVRANRALSM